MTTHVDTLLVRRARAAKLAYEPGRAASRDAARCRRSCDAGSCGSLRAHPQAGARATRSSRVRAPIDSAAFLTVAAVASIVVALGVLAGILADEGQPTAAGAWVAQVAAAPARSMDYFAGAFAGRNRSGSVVSESNAGR